MPTWGTVSTVKSDIPSLQRFMAHHVSIGASWIAIYFDDPFDPAFDLIKDMPNVHAFQCTPEYWKNSDLKFQEAHQHRQVYNASQAYKIASVDWLANIDVDEFITSDFDIAELLDDVDDRAMGARLRPVEALAFDPSAEVNSLLTFSKKLPNNWRRRDPLFLDVVYQGFADCLRAGFLSHTAGKNFARTGIANLTMKLHRLLIDGQEDVILPDLDETTLVHMHATDWEDWIGRFGYRLEHGAYRMRANVQERGRHNALKKLLTTKGEAGMRLFFEETQTANDALVERLSKADMLHMYQFDFKDKVAALFPKT